jgi:hypothetical protein
MTGEVLMADAMDHALDGLDLPHRITMARNTHDGRGIDTVDCTLAQWRSEIFGERRACDGEAQ